VLMNPAHPGFREIRFCDPEPFEFDLRMFRPTSTPEPRRRRPHEPRSSNR
jgi:hypothetical protein